MPSLRPNRKSSRTSSPAVRPVTDPPSAAPAVLKREKAQTLTNAWAEPPLKAPAPSFEDFGLERHGVFEQMAPLGSIPTEKLKLKLKFKSEVPRKLAVDKANSASASPELTPPIEQMMAPKPATSTKVSEKEKTHAPNGYGAVGVAAPPKAVPKVMAAAAAPTNGIASTNHASKKPVSGLMTVTDRGPPTTRNAELREKYDVIVAAAVEKSISQGQEILGRACMKIYEDSHYDQDKAVLLDAVLNITATEQQRAAFAKIVKKAKRAIRVENSAKESQSVGSNRTAAATSKPAPARNDKPTSAIPNTTKATPPPFPSPSPIDQISTPTTPATAFTALVARAAPEPRAARHKPAASALMNGKAPEPMPITNGVGTRLRNRSSRTLAATQLAEPTTMKQAAHHPAPATNGRETRSGRRRASTSSLSSVDEEIVNEGPPPPSLGAGAKRSAFDAGLDLEDEQNTAQRRKFASELETRRNDYELLTQTSDLRHSPPAPRSKSRITLNFTGGGRTTRSNQQRRALDETEVVDTPMLDTPMLSPNPQGVAPSATHSRSGRSLGPPDRHVARKPRTGARTKISPVKNRSTVAGVPSINGHGMNHPSRQGSPSRGNVSDEDTDDENFDECTACGEAGELLCCDGCQNAFHFKCCDPPLKSKAPTLDEPYFCYSCTERAERVQEAPTKGIFGALLDDLKSTNVQSFQLPRSVQRYFEGVGCKENGEYYDSSKPRPPTKPRTAGWDEQGENGRNKEKDKLMRCKFCKESSLTNRPIIQCDVCQSHWHLDCLDPPQANPPPVSTDGKTRAFFRCPLHVTNDLLLIGNPALAFQNPDGSAQRGHRLRRPRSPTIITPAIERGNQNNGNIMVYDNEEDEPVRQEDGVVYNLSSNSIKLDFIARVKQRRAERQAKKYSMASLAQLPANMRSEIQLLISAEVSRQVEARVREEMTAFHAKQAAADLDFLNRPAREQNMAIFLTRFAQEGSRAVDNGNLATLARATASVDPAGTLSTISVDDLQQLQGFIADAIKKTGVESTTSSDGAVIDLDDDLYYAPKLKKAKTTAKPDVEMTMEATQPTPPTEPMPWSGTPEQADSVQDGFSRFTPDGSVESTESAESVSEQQEESDSPQPEKSTRQQSVEAVTQQPEESAVQQQEDSVSQTQEESVSKQQEESAPQQQEGVVLPHVSGLSVPQQERSLSVPHEATKPAAKGKSHGRSKARSKSVTHDSPGKVPRARSKSRRMSPY